MAKVNPIPEGHGHAVPYLCVKGAAAAIEFYKKAFGATETMRMAEPGGKIGHAQLMIGGSLVMLNDEYPDFGVLSPPSVGGTPVRIHVYVADVDALTRRAAAAGAKVVRPPADQFYGDRSATLEDPFGHVWIFATHREDVPPAEMEKRWAAFQKG
jgi:PhnB protein